MQYKQIDNIELITCESGDWEILKVNGEEYASGHEISNYEWVELIRDLFNTPVIETEVTDEEIEIMC